MLRWIRSWMPSLNGLKSVEDALNDGAARMQQILDRAG